MGRLSVHSLNAILILNMWLASRGKKSKSTLLRDWLGTKSQGMYFSLEKMALKGGGQQPRVERFGKLICGLGGTQRSNQEESNPELDRSFNININSLYTTIYMIAY